MTLEQTYRDKLISEIIKAFLLDGVIPTTDQIDDKYDSAVGLNHDLSQPLVAFTNPGVKENEESSAIKYNDFLNRTKSDLEAVYSEVWRVIEDSNSCADRWMVELEGFRRQLVDLERRIDSLLLLTNDTTGFYGYVEDNFVDLSKVDQTQSTVFVDVDTHMVTFGKDIENVEQVYDDTIEVPDVNFRLISRMRASTSTNGNSMTVTTDASDATTVQVAAEIDVPQDGWASIDIDWGSSVPTVDAPANDRQTQNNTGDQHDNSATYNDGTRNSHTMGNK